ncbi:outer membrane protein OprM precursor [mine drainage metagenome]|uniref:Outer membrane protein OprM n=1 Tax=mine drainage metagenome TaxID=410659 RepID=A0A1J5RE97_9ZZZZ
MKSLLLACSLLALAACSVGPDYQRPAQPVPKGWSNQDQAGAWPAADWWQGFRSPGLMTLLAQARRANPDLAAAVARVRQADAEVKIAGGALWPSLSLGALGERTRLPTGNGKPPVGSNLYDVLPGASYEVDLWGRYADQVEAAKALADASRFDRETTALTVEADLADTYFAILAGEDRLRAAQGNLTAARQTLDALTARLGAGTVSALDVAQQQSVVDGLAAALPPLEQSIRQNRAALALLVGQLPESLPLPQGGLNDLAVPAVRAGLPAGLLARRPDVAAAEAQLRAANADIKQAHAALFPDIALTAEGGLESALLSGLTKPGGVVYALAASVSQPIFEGGALQGGIELEQGLWQETSADYRKAVINAYADVESALAAADAGNRQEQAARAAARTARTAFEISQAQLASGTVDLLSVLNTQRTWFSAQDSYLQARQAHLQALVGLFRALGGGWSRSDKV